MLQLCITGKAVSVPNKIKSFFNRRSTILNRCIEDEATRARLADRDAANAEILAAMLAAQADGDPGA